MADKVVKLSSIGLIEHSVRDENCVQLAKRFNAPRSTVHAIVARASWKYT